MHHRLRTIRRLAGTTALIATLVATTSCAGQRTGQQDAAQQDTNPQVADAHDTHAAGSPPPAAALRPGERFSTLTMAQPYTPVAPDGATDEYRCFLVDPGLTKAAYLTGSQFLPQNAAIVHHAIFFRVDPKGAAAARKTDAETPGPGWTCFGNAGLGEDAAWVAHWAPGANETLLQPDVGYPMAPGSQLVMQVHYNLLATQGKPGGTDQSSIRLRLSDRSDLRPLQTALLPAAVELACGPGEAGPLCDRQAAVRDLTHRFGAQAAAMVDGLNKRCEQGRTPVPAPVQTCDHPVPGPATIYAVAGHMHLLGRSISIELNPGTAGARTLLDVPNYNFDEQAIRPLAEPVMVKRGDTLRVTCRHDVGLRQMLPQLQHLPPRYVVWGEGTSDEMCLGLVILSPTT